MSLNEQLICDMNMIAWDLRDTYQQIPIDWKHASVELPNPKIHDQIMVWQKEDKGKLKGKYRRINIFKCHPKTGIWKCDKTTLGFDTDWYWAPFNPEALIIHLFRHPVEEYFPRKPKPTKEELEKHSNYFFDACERAEFEETIAKEKAKQQYLDAYSDELLASFAEYEKSEEYRAKYASVKPSQKPN